MLSRHQPIRIAWLAGACVMLLASVTRAATTMPMHDHHAVHAMPASQAHPTRGYSVNGNVTITFICCEYDPGDVTIAVGDSVTWRGAFSSHPLQEVDGPDSDNPVDGGFGNSTGTTYTHKFDAPGVHYYLCTIHGTFGGGMRGSVTVNDASSVPGPNDLRDVKLRVAPNPTFVGATITFALPRAMDARLDLFDLHGARVQRLESGTLSAGEHRLIWDGKDLQGNATGSGIYFVRLSAGRVGLESKLVKLR